MARAAGKVSTSEEHEHVEAYEMNRHRIGLFLIMVIALSGFTGNCEAQFAKDVRIVNKSALSPERLADALAAKALLTNSDPKLLRNAVVYGSVMGSFCCESFGVGRFRTLTRAEIDARYHEFKTITSF